jgi:hypothetical protein
MPFYLRGKRGLVEAVIEPSVVEAALRMRGCLAEAAAVPRPRAQRDGSTIRAFDVQTGIFRANREERATVLFQVTFVDVDRKIERLS